MPNTHPHRSKREASLREAAQEGLRVLKNMSHALNCAMSDEFNRELFARKIALTQQSAIAAISKLESVL